MNRWMKTALSGMMALTMIGAAPDAARPERGGLSPYLNGLVDQSGRPIAPGRFAGKFVLVNFIFTGCGSTCPIQMAELTKFDRSLPPAIRAKLALLSISVDPANDTPRRLATYARTFDVDGRRWSLATGRPADILRITRAFAAMRPGSGDCNFHSSEVRLFDPQQRMIQRYAAAPLAERQLRADLTALATRS
ncbi:hypothetical protein ASE59_03255 [Sphingomonas sp. Leaf10]|nr:hypothetical protein ASE59_03255 [Sphingomonas sp. Leaf10]